MQKQPVTAADLEAGDWFQLGPASSITQVKSVTVRPEGRMGITDTHGNVWFGRQDHPALRVLV